MEAAASEWLGRVAQTVEVVQSCRYVHFMLSLFTVQSPICLQIITFAASDWPCIPLNTEIAHPSAGPKEKSGPLLRECTTPEQLSRVEAEVRNAIKAWDRRSDKDGAHVGRGMRQGTGVGTSHQDALATGTNLQLTWDSVCDWVVGRQLDLWYNPPPPKPTRDANYPSSKHGSFPCFPAPDAWLP